MDRPYTIADVKPFLDAIAQSGGAPDTRLAFVGWLEARGCFREAHWQRDRMGSPVVRDWKGELSYLRASANADPDFRWRDGSTFRQLYDSMYREWWADPRGERSALRAEKAAAG
jgi:hypothetical protein